MYFSTLLGTGLSRVNDLGAGRRDCPPKRRSTRMTSVTTARPDHAHGTLPRRRIIGPARAVCRLTMAINGVEYKVEPSPPEAYAVRKAYRLSKPDGTAYDVA